MFNFYKKIVSPLVGMLFGGGCRYYPTCSDYTKQSVKKYGLVLGGFKGLIRVISCNPFSKKAYYDPVK